MFFHSVEFARRGVGTTRLVGDHVAGGVLGGKRNSPPQIATILADPGFDEITAVVIFGHADLIPGYGDLVAIPPGAHILRGTVHVGTDGLQVGDNVAHSVKIANHIDD